jgi:hypothetical protein
MAPGTTSELTPDQLAEVAMDVVATYSGLVGFLRAAQPLAVTLEGFGQTELAEKLLDDCRQLSRTMGSIGSLTSQAAEQWMAQLGQADRLAHSEASVVAAPAEPEPDADDGA